MPVDKHPYKGSSAGRQLKVPKMGLSGITAGHSVDRQKLSVSDADTYDAVTSTFFRRQAPYYVRVRSDTTDRPNP